MSGMTPDERDCGDMRDLVQGRDSALNDLMERHARKLFHYLIRILQNESDAEDIAQESFARVYLHRNRFQPRRKFSTWLYTIATNLARDQLRYRTRHPRVSMDAPAPGAEGDFKAILPAKNSSPSEAMQAGERASVVRSAIDQLPEENRVPFVLAEFEERSQAEIGAILGCSVKAVEMRIYRARKELREKLAGIR